MPTSQTQPAAVFSAALRGTSTKKKAVKHQQGVVAPFEKIQDPSSRNTAGTSIHWWGVSATRKSSRVRPTEKMAARHGGTRSPGGCGQRHFDSRRKKTTGAKGIVQLGMASDRPSEPATWRRCWGRRR